MNSYLQKIFGAVYRRWIRSKLSSLQQQRFKLLFTVWGYRSILSIKTISLKDRVRVILNSIAVDWNIQHGHWPGEIARVMATIGERKAKPGEVRVLTMETRIIVLIWPVKRRFLSATVFRSEPRSPGRFPRLTSPHRPARRARHCGA